MSHVVGEVTYVELFKDAEGKSRVSDVDKLHKVLNALCSLLLILWVAAMLPVLLNWRWVVVRA